MVSRALPGTTPSTLVRGLVLPDRDRADVIAFLRSFTDPSVLTDPRWQDPWARSP